MSLQESVGAVIHALAPVVRVKPIEHEKDYLIQSDLVPLHVDGDAKRLA